MTQADRTGTPLLTNEQGFGAHQTALDRSGVGGYKPPISGAYSSNYLNFLSTTGKQKHT